MNLEILKTIRERGLLLEKDIFDLLSNFNDVALAKTFLEGLERFSGQKIITRSTLNKNFEYVQSIVNKLPGENKHIVENIFVKLGISLEIRNEKEIVDKNSFMGSEGSSFQVLCCDTSVKKKLEVKDFVGSFRARYQQIQRFLMNRPELQQNLVSINKISNNRQSLAIIGIVTEKRVTKNKNIIIKFEDLTGTINGLVKFDNADVFKKAEELQLDDVVGIKASGNRDILFVYDIFYPDAFIHQKIRFDREECVAFISDIHAGSKLHLGENVEKFIEWINGEDATAKKIKYLFIVGDNVDGVGVYPGQEESLSLKSLKEQYNLLASYLKRIPKRIKMFLCPGQHDASRVAEPQPIVDAEYAPELHNIDNLILVTNPARIKLFEGNKEFKILMYHGASIHSFIHNIPELREMKAHRTPAKAVRHMLKRRHLAPMHSAVTYIPDADNDPLVISEVPDILATGEVHRLDIDNYNGCIIITGSCWQAKTPFEEKVGNIPVPCKVPVFNLHTRELKIFDFL
ncbi:MAG TPA: metallophosphoesterase [Candidatus Nanoarchaeia archaeon]|nr:metallophosphoesterase [Candidatus Nanoarchaeia archaeon]